MNDDLNEMKEGNEILREQLEFYKKHKIKIHVLKKNSQFYNGFVLEIASDFFIMDDDKLGGMPIHFIEINILEKSIK